jgi:hypothetical protein
MADGCADLTGCLDVFSAGSFFGKDGPDGCGLMFIIPIVALTGLIQLVTPNPPPPQPKLPITERVKDVVKRPINRYKIKKAKKAYDKKQAEAAKTKKPTLKQRFRKWLNDG